jgi:hypothetical protein
LRIASSIASSRARTLFGALALALAGPEQHLVRQDRPEKFEIGLPSHRPVLVQRLDVLALVLESYRQVATALVTMAGPSEIATCATSDSATTMGAKFSAADLEPATGYRLISRGGRAAALV